MNVTQFDKAEKFDKKEVRFSDIALVSYLTCKGYKIKRVEKVGRSKVDFVYDKSSELEQETLAFFNHEATIDPLKFYETFRNLKNLAISKARLTQPDRKDIRR